MRETTQLEAQPNIKIQRPGPEEFNQSLGLLPAADLERWADRPRWAVPTTASTNRYPLHSQ
jgi:hypothetical protein